MAFPVGWPPRPCSGRRSIRFFVSGTTTGFWADNAYLLIDDVGANTFVPMPYIKPGELTAVAVGDRNVPGSPMGTGSNPNDILPGDALGHAKALIWANSIRIFNDGSADLELTFGASTENGPIQGVVKAGEEFTYRDRYEAGIGLRWANGSRAVLLGGVQTFPFTAVLGQTLIVGLSTDGGTLYPTLRTFTWPAAVGPFANIAALVAALNTPSSWNGGTLPTEFTVGNSGDRITLTDAAPGTLQWIEVAAASTGNAGAANASLQFTDDQEAGGTGDPTTFRVEAW